MPKKNPFDRADVEKKKSIFTESAGAIDGRVIIAHAAVNLEEWLRAELQQNFKITVECIQDENTGTKILCCLVLRPPVDPCFQVEELNVTL